MCRSLYHTISNARTWQSYIRLSNESKFEVQWWFDNLQFYTKYPIIIDDASVLADAQISSDASGLGYFSVSLNQNVKLKSALFTQSQSICIKFKGLTFKHFTDSKFVKHFG